MLALASRYQGPRRPNRKEAPGFKAELKAISGAADIIARGLDAYRAGADRTAPTHSLHHLLERQHYKLGHWRLASSDINYRRFFDINTLAGLRVEDAGTFEAIHRLVKRLIAEGKLQGCGSTTSMACAIPCSISSACAGWCARRMAAQASPSTW
jgi:(1->4)-alpha-D-glucan 1-alpha-D-glucosylmutase